MTEPEFHRLLQRYLAGQDTPAESALVEQLYERLETAGEQTISPAGQEQRLAAMWQRLEARTQVSTPPQRVPTPPAFWRAPVRRWAAAVVLLAGLGAGVGWLRPAYKPLPPAPQAAADGWTRRTNATRQAQALRLPDGSLVTLQPGSRLRYATGLTGPRREVYFSGDGFFEVSKNPRRPFLVLTDQVVTTVLGTSFRVVAPVGAANATVTVREGRVAVQARAGARLDATPAQPTAAGVLLLPNQQVAYLGAAHQLRKELAATPAVLMPQSFVFDARPVAEVLAALETAYGVHIVFNPQAVAHCTVTLNLTGKPLAGKLAVLCDALGASYEQAGTDILFHSDGCGDK